MYCIALCCIVLYRIALYCIVSCCTVLYCNVLYCIIMCCITLHCIALYCIVWIVLYCTVVLCSATCCKNSSLYFFLSTYLCYSICIIRIKVLHRDAHTLDHIAVSHSNSRHPLKPRESQGVGHRLVIIR